MDAFIRRFPVEDLGAKRHSSGLAALFERWVLPGERAGARGLRLAIRNGYLNADWPRRHDELVLRQRDSDMRRTRSSLALAACADASHAATSESPDRSAATMCRWSAAASAIRSTP